MKASIHLDKFTTQTVDLGYGVGAVSVVQPDGSIIYYLNSRLSEEKRNDAFKAEMDMLRSDMEKATARKKATRRYLRYMDGSKVNGPMPVFYNNDVKRIGRGVYIPTLMNAGKLMKSIDVLRPLLRDICLYYDIRQTVPHLPVERFREATEGVSWEDVRFIGWTPGKTSLPALAHFDGNGITGTIYYKIDGSIDCITLVIAVEHDGHEFTITADIITRRNRLSINSIYRSIDGKDFVQIY